jgi:hypothetical protein
MKKIQVKNYLILVVLSNSFEDDELKPLTNKNIFFNTGPNHYLIRNNDYLNYNIGNNEPNEDENEEQDECGEEEENELNSNYKDHARLNVEDKSEKQDNYIDDIEEVDGGMNIAENIVIAEHEHENENEHNYDNEHDVEYLNKDNLGEIIVQDKERKPKSKPKIDSRPVPRSESMKQNIEEEREHKHEHEHEQELGRDLDDNRAHANSVQNSLNEKKPKDNLKSKSRGNNNKKIDSGFNKYVAEEEINYETKQFFSQEKQNKNDEIDFFNNFQYKLVYNINNI